jgi:hypothetical protein
MAKKDTKEIKPKVEKAPKKEAKPKKEKSMEDLVRKYLLTMHGIAPVK